MLQIKDDPKGRKMLKELQKPSRRHRLDADLPSGSQMVEKLERRLVKAEKRIEGLETQLNNVTAKVITMENKK